MDRMAIWALTPNGARLAVRLASHFPEAVVFLSMKIPTAILQEVPPFSAHHQNPSLDAKDGRGRPPCLPLGSHSDKHQWEIPPGQGQPRGVAPTNPGSQTNPDPTQLPNSPKETVPAIRFDRLGPELQNRFREFDGHVFIMSTGIVVRLIAPLLRAKTEDPAVVVMDELGVHAISLVSGHIGGANALARRVAEAIGATPVITTATDVNQLPAVDAIAAERGIRIENPSAIRAVSMALLNGERIGLHDPMGWMEDSLREFAVSFEEENWSAGVWVDHRNTIDPKLAPKSTAILRLRPPSLVAGMGCNRGTDVGELRSLLLETLEAANLSPQSLAAIASVDVKADEPGLQELARELGIPFQTFPRESLRAVTDVPTPSEMVQRHVGTPSVCEAAALLGAGESGKLLVAKRKSVNGTVAVAEVRAGNTRPPQDRRGMKSPGSIREAP
jgi:cobalt-precorrin 5A hydrolase